MSAYYHLPRRATNVTVLVAVLIIALVAGVIVALAPRWLPQVAYALEAEAPLSDPDVVVLGSDGDVDAEAQEAVALLRRGEVEAVVLAGRPFSPDDFLPITHGRRLAVLLRLGVPRDRIVEVYDGEDTYEQLTALRDVAEAHGWRRVLFLVSPPGTRRHLLAARQILNPVGIAVGQRVFPSDTFEPERWWRSEIERSRVLLQWVLLSLTVLSGRG